MELSERKPTRLKNYDYSTTGAYFITVCTQDRKEILSTIVGEGSALPELTTYGEITDRIINEIPDKYQNVSVDHYVIMPNHIHLILSIRKESGRADPSPTATSVIGWLKYRTTKEILQINGNINQKIFQRSFYDHIIRNRDDYDMIARYIHDNPMKWKYDRFYLNE